MLWTEEAHDPGGEMLRLLKYIYWFFEILKVRLKEKKK